MCVLETILLYHITNLNFHRAGWGQRVGTVMKVIQKSLTLFPSNRGQKKNSSLI